MGTATVQPCRHSHDAFAKRATWFNWVDYWNRKMKIMEIAGKTTEEAEMNGSLAVETTKVVQLHIHYWLQTSARATTITLFKGDFLFAQPIHLTPSVVILITMNWLRFVCFVHLFVRLIFYSSDKTLKITRNLCISRISSHVFCVFPLARSRWLGLPKIKSLEMTLVHNISLNESSVFTFTPN